MSRLVVVLCAAPFLLPGPASAAKPKAELVVTKLGPPPPALAAGATMTVEDTVKNKSKRAKRSRNAYLLSLDKFRDLADVELIGSRRVPKLKRDAASKGSAELMVPATTLSGDYRLLACADAKGKVRERSESNNCRASKARVSIAGLAPPDTAAPAAPSIIDTDPDPPANDNTPEVKGAGAETGSTVTIYAGSDCSGAAIGSGTAEAFNGSTGITAGPLGPGSTALRATATDAAGNASSCSTPFSYTHDSSLPVAPTITATTPPSPANDKNPEVRGNAEGGSTVRIYGTIGCSGPPIGTGPAATFNAGGITVTVLDNEPTPLSATATDGAGNTSACSAPFGPYVEDSAAPATPTINETQPHSPANAEQPAVLGTGAEAGSTVRIYSTPACTGAAIGSGTAAAFNGTVGITALVPPDTATDLRATATDAAGNISGCSDPFTYVEDSTAAAPTLTGTNPPSPADDNNPEVTGTAEAGSAVRIFGTADCTGAPIATGTASQLAAPGITITVADNSTTTLTANLTDAAGNASPCSTAITYVEVTP
jgi:hypothetical protein